MLNRTLNGLINMKTRKNFPNFSNGEVVIKPRLKVFGHGLKYLLLLALPVKRYQHNKTYTWYSLDLMTLYTFIIIFATGWYLAYGHSRTFRFWKHSEAERKHCYPQHFDQQRPDIQSVPKDTRGYLGVLPSDTYKFISSILFFSNILIYL